MSQKEEQREEAFEIFSHIISEVKREVKSGQQPIPLPVINIAQGSSLL